SDCCSSSGAMPRGWARLCLAHPSLLGEPFMLCAADRTVDPRKEHRHGAKALAVGDDAGRDLSSRSRTSDHHGAHLWPLPVLAVVCSNTGRMRTLFDATESLSRRIRRGCFTRSYKKISRPAGTGVETRALDSDQHKRIWGRSMPRPPVDDQARDSPVAP